MTRILSGIGLGVLLGLVLGLSISDVAVSFLAAAVAIAAAALGFAPLPEKAALKPSDAQLAAFSLSCAACIALGIFLRSHGTLGPVNDGRSGRICSFSIWWSDPADSRQ